MRKILIQIDTSVLGWCNRVRYAVSFVFFVFIGLTFFETTAQTQTYYSPNPNMDSGFNEEDLIMLDYGSLFHKDADSESGIIGTINGESSQISVRVFMYDYDADDGLGQEVYYAWIDETQSEYSELYNIDVRAALPEVLISETLDYAQAFLYNTNDLKGRAQFYNVYDNNNCEPGLFSKILDNIKISFGDFSSRCKTPVQPVVIKIEVQGQATLGSAKVPGVGKVELDESLDILFRDTSGNFKVFCENPENSENILCDTLDKLQNPEDTETDDGLKEDLFIAMHRGWWGYDLGTGPPENSLLSVQSANETYPNNPIIEMDLTLTKDDRLIFMHDFALNRLTDYSGDAYSFELPWSDISPYNVKRRDGTIVDDTPLTKFHDVLEFVRDNNLIMMVDVKELQSWGSDDECVANCDYQSKEKQEKSWQKVTRQILRQAESMQAKKNLIIKTYYTYNRVRELIGDKMMPWVLWTPMIVPNRFSKGEKGQQEMVEFIQEWNREGINMVACFETNFFPENDIQLKPFSNENVQYQNLLHYIYANTGRRSGVFSEEPVDPKGTVNRWGSWGVKDTRKDVRADILFLLKIPYGRQMLITTDRVDIWQDIKEKL